VGMAEATAATATAAALPTPMRSQSSVEPWQQNHHSSNEDDPFFPPSAGMGVRRTSTDPHALTTPDLSWLLLGDPSGGGGGGTAAGEVSPRVRLWLPLSLPGTMSVASCCMSRSSCCQ
jgi:hypothetical protein